MRYFLKFNDSKCVKNRAYKNSNNDCRSEVSDNNCIKLYGLKGRRFANFVDNSLGSNEVTDDDACEECAYRHKNRICNEVHEVENIEANNLDVAQCAVTQ